MLLRNHAIEEIQSDIEIILLEIGIGTIGNRDWKTSLNLGPAS